MHNNQIAGHAQNRREGISLTSLRGHTSNKPMDTYTEDDIRPDLMERISNDLLFVGISASALLFWSFIVYSIYKQIFPY